MRDTSGPIFHHTNQVPHKASHWPPHRCGLRYTSPYQKFVPLPQPYLGPLEKQYIISTQLPTNIRQNYKVGTFCE